MAKPAELEPSVPVIVIHLTDDSGLRACSGKPMPMPADRRYDRVPRVLCVGCQKLTRGHAESGRTPTPTPRKDPS